MEYAEFLEKKIVRAQDVGFNVDQTDVNPMLFGFQRDIVRWACRRGRAAIFADCGLGKTPMQLEWARLVCEQTDGSVLILAPLAVAAQTRREGQKFGVDVTVCRSQSDVRQGVNVANYEMLGHFDPAAFVGVVLDESSILKNFMGKTKREIVDAFRETPYKLACTATPAPNDHLELGNHSDFLNVMPSHEMIMRWFTNDTMVAGGYRLKQHAEKDYWAWVASWAVSMAHPSDLGYPDDGFVLPPLHVHEHIVEVDHGRATDCLFAGGSLSATTMHGEMRATCNDRADRCAELVGADDGTWVIWCNTNYEADAIMARIPDAREVRGSDSVPEKERALEGFAAGDFRVLVTKPSICAFGLNWQHCHNMAFVGLSYSYEQFYQATRRTWRYGQTQPVNAHVICAESEGDVLLAIQRKQKDHRTMQREMVAAASGALLEDRERSRISMSDDVDVARGTGWELRLGDSCALVRDVPDNSVQLSVFSPPFSNLYTYSDALQDMGNCAGDEEFMAHFDYLIPELLRVTVPGRNCCIHCKDLPMYKGRDGAAGLRDFPGLLIRSFERHGWVFHSRVTIWKDPVIEMQRTKNHGLLYKQLRKDSSASRQGMADYIITMRKWSGVGDGEEWPDPVTHEREEFPLDQWQEWASPVWTTIRQTNVLNCEAAREPGDEKHICPLQLDVIERCVKLWSNPGDLVLSPFAGIGSEGYVALKSGRRFLGMELKRSYWETACRNMKNAETERTQMTIFDFAN